MSDALEHDAAYVVEELRQRCRILAGIRAERDRLYAALRDMAQ